jgi:hypothetical protein
MEIASCLAMTSQHTAIASSHKTFKQWEMTVGATLAVAHDNVMSDATQGLCRMQHKGYVGCNNNSYVGYNIRAMSDTTIIAMSDAT